MVLIMGMHAAGRQASRRAASSNVVHSITQIILIRFLPDLVTVYMDIISWSRHMGVMAL